MRVYQLWALARQICATIRLWGKTCSLFLFRRYAPCQPSPCIHADTRVATPSHPAPTAHPINQSGRRPGRQRRSGVIPISGIRQAAAFCLDILGAVTVQQLVTRQHRPPRWTTSSHIREIKSCFGMKAIGDPPAITAIAKRPPGRMEDLATPPPTPRENEKRECKTV